MAKRLVWLTVATVLALGLVPGAALAGSGGGILKIGDQNEYVRQLQEKLCELGLLSAEPTGYFGTMTQQAVIEYQAQSGLQTDGKAGPDTLLAIMGRRFSMPSGVSGPGVFHAASLYPGDKGEAVAELQQRLKALDYYRYSVITGFFGPVTEQAVLRFQRAHNLAADGIAGSDTLSALSAPNARHDFPYSEESGSAVSSAQPAASVDTMLGFAAAQRDCPYVYAANGPDAFDSAGLLSFVLRNAGVCTQRLSAREYAGAGCWEKVTRINALLPGDLLFFSAPDSPRVSHAGIYLGDGQFIHASSSAGCVVISRLEGDWSRRFSLARRVF